MGWNNAATGSFFDNDDDFQNHYCGNLTLANLGVNGPSISTLRRVIKRLTELVPRAAHSSSGWSGGNPPPLAAGRLQLNGCIRHGYRFGLRVLGDPGRLHLWVDARFIDAYLGRWGQFWNDGTWKDWNPIFKYFTAPVDINDGTDIPENWPFRDGHPLAELLRFLNENLPAQPQEKIMIRVQDFRDFEENTNCIDAIYPKLINTAFSNAD